MATRVLTAMGAMEGIGYRAGDLELEPHMLSYLSMGLSVEVCLQVS